MGYWANLEQLWLSRGGNHYSAEMDTSFEWPKGLRGKDLCEALYALHLHYDQDPRFIDALVAMQEYGIVDKHLRFDKTWKPPLDIKMDVAIFKGVEAMKKEGWKVRRACAEFAARATPPIYGNSFEAVVNRLRAIHAKVAKMVQQKNDNDG